MTRTRIDESPNVVVRPAPLQPKAGWKPEGFWYSVDGDWERWCEAEEPNWVKGKHVHEVLLGSEEMLHIKTPSKLRAFHQKYNAGNLYINWSLVASEYDGIEIAPYIWECRHDFNASWYYSWDCASGCIWKPKGVEVKPIVVSLT